MAYPISRGSFVNFVATEYHPHKEGTHLGGPWVTEVDPSNVKSLFHGWEKEVIELVQVSAGRDMMHTQKTLMILFPVYR